MTKGEAESAARELIAAGYMQTSRKFRHVNRRLPPGKLGKAALAEVDSELAERLSNPGRRWVLPARVLKRKTDPGSGNIRGVQTPQGRNSTMRPKIYKNPETAERAAERIEAMRGRGYITVAEAAELVNYPRSNIYHWIGTGELRKDTWGNGSNSIFVLLSDLMIKVPAAFRNVKRQPDGKPPTAPKPLKAEVRRAARRRAL